MADLKEQFEKWQKTTKEKFEEIDKQLGLKEKIEESAKAVKEATQKGAENLKESLDKIKNEVEKTETGKQAVKFTEDAAKTFETTAKNVYRASEPVRQAAEEAGEKAAGKAADAVATSVVEAEKIVKETSKKAGEVIKVASEKASEVFEDASETFKKTGKAAAGVFSFGASWTRTFNSLSKTIQKTADWVEKNPLQAAATGVSMIVGAGLGAGFTLISSNWLFRSALPEFGVKQLSEQFMSYLEKQEELVKNGELSEAEAERIRFERDVVKYAGAPLMGAFSCAAGAMMWANIFNPRTITGAPISWLLGGNPVLEGVWLFGNGLVCFKIGCEIFMVSLEDQEDVQKIVKEIKGMLPSVAT